MAGFDDLLDANRDFAEHFELGDRALLTAGYPSYSAEIAALTRDEPVGRMR